MLNLELEHRVKRLADRAGGESVSTLRRSVAQPSYESFSTEIVPDNSQTSSSNSLFSAAISSEDSEHKEITNQK